MHSLPLDKEILKMKKDFWGLILIVERDTKEYQILNIHHKYVSPFIQKILWYIHS